MVKLVIKEFKPLKLPINYVRATRAMRAQARLQYIEEQDNLCYFCSEDIHKAPPDKILEMPLVRANYPRSFFDHPIHLHHCHETDKTIGATHAYCNAVLFEYYGE